MTENIRRQGPMLNEGLRATVNSDDPAYFDSYSNENYKAFANAGVEATCSN